jgi:hypothetical protein
MPTARPRIQVTVTESQYQLLKRLAKLQSRSMSAVLSELFDQIEPVYERVAVVLQAAVRAQASMKEGMTQGMEQAEAELAPLVGAAMGQLDLLVNQAEGYAADAAARSRAEHGSAAASPRPVTRGSGTHTRTHPSPVIRPSPKVNPSRKSRPQRGKARKSGRSGKGRTA